MDGEEVTGLRFQQVQEAKRAFEHLQASGIRTYEGDFRFTDQALVDLEIRGSLKIEGSWKRGKHVDRVYINPDLKPDDWTPDLSVLSIDIETDIHDGHIITIGLVHKAPWKETQEEVLFLGDSGVDDGIADFPSEGLLLSALCKKIQELDPDIITGWNVIDFDIPRIFERLDKNNIKPIIGRSDDIARLLPPGRGHSPVPIIPGREVVDGLRLVRAGPDRFPDFTLETVANGVLGTGKLISYTTTREKLQTLERMYRENPKDFCSYCLQDARLVLQIIEKTGLLDLTFKRSLLIGVQIGRAWTSISSFENLYTRELHRRGYVSPSLGVDPLPQGQAPGGGIIPPRTGLFSFVYIFDYKSLYPAIIRTFNIDPLSYYKGLQPGEQTIEIPGGYRFSTEDGILPSLLKEFFARRAEAKEQGDPVASFVYKIIMNSFYGVLGSSGCRFAGVPLAAGITQTGQHILHQSQTFFEEMGYRVLYGDTDSLFVEAKVDRRGEGEKLCLEVNKRISDYIKQTFGVESRLELEFEKTYRKLFLPPLRGAVYEGARGRAKGYAGVTLEGEIEIKGMEAVRRDWTDAAKQFQIALLKLIFEEKPAQMISDFIRLCISDLQNGRIDEKLLYIKSLRKPVESYIKSHPPHVKAALLLPEEERRGLIRYWMTLEGPQPAGYLKAPLDYEHYLEKQLLPIAKTFENILGRDIDNLFSREQQLDLFD